MIDVEAHAPAAVTPPTPLTLASTTVTWHGASFTLDVQAARQGIVEHLLVEGKQLRDLAAAANVSRMSLWRFMQGKQCSPATVRRILSAAGVDLKRVVRSGLAALTPLWLSNTAQFSASVATLVIWDHQQEAYWLTHHLTNLPGHPVSRMIESALSLLPL